MIDVDPQVKLAVSHHGLGEDSVTPEKPLVFTLDPPQVPKGKKKKKEKATTLTSFGAKIAVTKIKGSAKLSIGWRIRRGAHQ